MALIYGLMCIPSGKTYIGCTRAKPQKRFREHRCWLRAGSHACAGLQKDWSEIGELGFRLVVLDVCHDDLISRREAELKWMDLYCHLGKLYNEHIISFRPSDEAIRKGVANAHKEPGNRWTPEVNEKRRLAQLGKPKGHGAKISATKRAKAAMR